MRINQKNKDLVQKLVKHYCKKMKIGDPPDLTFEILHHEPMRDYDSWGAYYADANLLWVNLRVHTSEMFMEYTIVHELVHAKFMKLKHGDKFNKKVDHIYDKKIA